MFKTKPSPNTPEFWTAKKRQQVSEALEAHHSRAYMVKRRLYEAERHPGETFVEFVQRKGLQSRSEAWRKKHSTIMKEYWAGVSKEDRKKHRAKTALALLERKLRHNRDLGMKESGADYFRLEELRKALGD